MHNLKNFNHSTSRELRNKAEKMRRDRLNMFIDELKKLLPEIASTSCSNEPLPRPIDTTKTTILRLATNILKLNKSNIFQNQFKSSFEYHHDICREITEIDMN